MSTAADGRHAGRDAVLAAAATAVVWVVSATAVEPPADTSPVAGIVLGVVVGVLLFALRRHPVAALSACAAAVVAYQLTGWPAIGLVWPLLLPIWSAAAAGRLRPAAAVVVVLALGSAGWRLLVERDGPLVLLGEAQGLVVAGLALAVGDAVWQRRRRAIEAAASATAAAAAAEQDAQRRLAEQRLAVAADLHDVAAHHLVLIGLQLRLAEDSGLGASPACRAAISAALRAHDDALRETTRTVRLLHGQPPLEPPPALADLDRLRPVADQAGVQLTIDVDDALRVSPPVALTVFRIAQEALTNTLRHSTAGRADLTLDAAGSELHLRFADDGQVDPAGATPPPLRSAGLGLAGMAARAESLGGRFRTSRGRGGCFVVEAWFPRQDTA